MLVKEVLYDLNDVTIVPSRNTRVRHRGNINARYTIDGKEYLPIFVSPMECVINKENFDIYDKNNVIPILPRTESLADREIYTLAGKWAAYGLAEFVDLFCNDDNVTCYIGKHLRVLIDNANGHMAELPEQIKVAKSKAQAYNYTIEIMAGNVANEWAYVDLANAGADYVRVDVGNGNCCITSSQTGNNKPIASLIDDCRKLKEQYNLKCAIIIDGGISSYGRANKALALGADYVMIGSLFGSCFESASDFISAEFSVRDVIDDFNLSKLNSLRFDTNISEDEKKKIIGAYKPVKTVWGMSTRRAQLSIGLAQGKKKEDIKLKTSEGVEKKVNVEHTLHQWLENFEDYLKSSMSYNDAFNLQEYIGKPTVMLLSPAAQNSINK